LNNKFNKFGLEIKLDCIKCDYQFYTAILSICGIPYDIYQCPKCSNLIQIDINTININIELILEKLNSSVDTYESDDGGDIAANWYKQHPNKYIYKGVNLAKCAEWDLYPMLKNELLNQSNG